MVSFLINFSFVITYPILHPEMPKFFDRELTINEFSRFLSILANEKNLFLFVNSEYASSQITAKLFFFSIF